MSISYVDDWLRLPGLSIHQARALANLPVWSHFTARGHRHSFEYATAATKAVWSRCQIFATTTRTVTPINPLISQTAGGFKNPTAELSLAKAVVQNRMLSGPYRLGWFSSGGCCHPVLSPRADALFCAFNRWVESRGDISLALLLDP